MQIQSPERITVTPADFFETLSGVIRRATKASLTKNYRQLREVFRLAISQQLYGVDLTFCGTFQKLDYLIRQAHLAPELRAQIYNLNRRLSYAVGTTTSRTDATPKAHKSKEETEVFSIESLKHDVKTLARMIAALYGVEIPALLNQLLPANDPPIRWSGLDMHALRVIVDSWDDAYIYCHAEMSDENLKVCYSSANRYLHHDNKDIDWTYIRLLLIEGCQLNLVHIRRASGILYPEVIVYEPDLLIDITDITRCFAPYAESPWVGLIASLGASQPTIHTELGNLASQFLDETVNRQNFSYAQSISHFFVSNAFRLATLENLEKSGFHTNAQNQKQNIQHLIGEDLPKAVAAYDAEKVVLEPSFLCPTLGLQGRMDMLQSDHKVLLEQKSGKGAFAPASSTFDTDTPLPLEQHTLQLLLYRAVLHYGFRTKANNIEGIYLLYSKYARGLVSLTANSILLCRGIKVRNQMAWAWQFYAQGGLKHLLSLSPEKLNVKHQSGRFWNEYLKPQISAVLGPLQSALPQHQAYVLRMMTFVCRERILECIGNRQKDSSGRAALWQDAFDEKQQRGDAIAPLHISGVEVQDDTITHLDLSVNASQDLIGANFRVGDIVIIYPYVSSSLPDPCINIVYRSILERIDADYLRVKLRSPQRNPKVFGCRKLKSGKIIPNAKSNMVWAIEHDHVDSTPSLLRSIYSILTTAPSRRALILTERQPAVAADYTLKGDYGTFNPLVIKAQKAQDLFILIGPPGTGKTSFGLMSILREELLNAGSTILLTAYTNRAVDEICSKLVEADIDFLRLGNPQSCANEYHRYLASQRLAETRNLQQAHALIGLARVICATTTNLTRHPEVFKLKQFSLAIIDEASQILEPHIVGILSALHTDQAPAIKRFVLIGDHKQLPAVTKQTLDDTTIADPVLNDLGLRNCQDSLFQRLLHRYHDNPDITHMLTRQGRMHPDIANFPSQAFYDGRLKCVPLPHQNPGNKDSAHIHFVDVTPQAANLTYDNSNPDEARAIAKITYQIYKTNRQTFRAESTLGIIVPYRNQITSVRNAIAKYKIEQLKGITIDTVERYQGSQRDIIIYGFTVTKPQQLNFLTSQSFVENGITIDRKLNVALTRARHQLYLVGNQKLLSRVRLFRELISHITQNKATNNEKDTASTPAPTHPDSRNS